jgi:hypothetical protein
MPLLKTANSKVYIILEAVILIIICSDFCLGAGYALKETHPILSKFITFLWLTIPISATLVLTRIFKIETPIRRIVYIFLLITPFLTPLLLKYFGVF